MLALTIIICLFLSNIIHGFQINISHIFCVLGNKQYTLLNLLKEIMANSDWAQLCWALPAFACLRETQLEMADAIIFSILVMRKLKMTSIGHCSIIM